MEKTNATKAAAKAVNVMSAAKARSNYAKQREASCRTFSMYLNILRADADAVNCVYLAEVAKQAAAKAAEAAKAAKAAKAAAAADAEAAAAAKAVNEAQQAAKQAAAAAKADKKNAEAAAAAKAAKQAAADAEAAAQSIEIYAAAQQADAAAKQAAADAEAAQKRAEAAAAHAVSEAKHVEALRIALDKSAFKAEDITPAFLRTWLANAMDINGNICDVKRIALEDEAEAREMLPAERLVMIDNVLCYLKPIALWTFSKCMQKFAAAAKARAKHIAAGRQAEREAAKAAAEAKRIAAYKMRIAEYEAQQAAAAADAKILADAAQAAQADAEAK